MSKCGNLKKTLDLLRNDCNLAEIFKFNMFSEDIEFTRIADWDKFSRVDKPISDIDLVFLKNYMSTVHGWEPNKDVLGDACLIISSEKTYHPIKDYIESEEWDGVPRCDEWLINAVNCDDNLYTRSVSGKFLVATVSRIYNPGCKFDHMLILEGDQGIGKSTLCELMACDWYLDTSFDNKDIIDCIRYAFWIEISELGGMSKKDADWLKSFLSRKIDRVRMPYARRTQNYHRKCVFIGTYNPSGDNMYLRDDTGNRRFWPVECRGSIDLEYLRKNRKQLWAEALVRYKGGELYYISDQNALDILDDMHHERELESPTFIKIKNWLRGRFDTTGIEVIEDALKIRTDGKNPKELLSIQTTVGTIMKKLKWKKGTNKDRHKYFAPEYEKGQEYWNE